MNENVTVCITPKGEKPVLHFSQFDNERVFTVTVLADDGKTAAVLTGLDIEFRLRKTDSHVVTIAPESVADNVITFKTTEQMCACCGQNIASVTLMKDDMNIATLDILVDIQRDILSGGLTSESDIRNLTTQIEQIVPEFIGDNYYNKQEVDDLLAEHTFDPTNYYNKSDVDGLLSDKADSDDVYTKTETDNLLADKADKSAIASLIVQKDVAKAPIASFNTDLAEALTKCIVDINPIQEGTGTPSLDNVRPISGFSALNVTLADGDMQTVDTATVNFGQTVYGGVADVTNGKVLIDRLYKTYNGSENWYVAGAQSGKYRVALGEVLDNVLYPISTSEYLDCICNMFEKSNSDATYRLVDGISYQPNSGLRIYSSSYDTNDITLWKTLLASTPLQVVYKLATPIEITTTPENLTAIVGQNNVYGDTNGDTTVRFTETIGNELGV